MLVGAGRQKQQKYPGFLAWEKFFCGYPQLWAFIHRYFESYPQCSLAIGADLLYNKRYQKWGKVVESGKK
ncbi:MAG: hypothetical protein ILA30_04640 [Selenomonas sp.]|nr:hypothetical protein [Selenomonas sp.]